MNSLFEYSDALNVPYEAFCYDTNNWALPVRSHWHYYVEVLYMLEGTLLLTCDSEEFIISPDQIFLFPPSSVHSISAGSEGRIRFNVLKFDLGQLESTIHSTETGNLRFSALFPASMPKTDDFLRIDFSAPGKEKEKERAKALFEGCIRETNGRDFGYLSITRSYLCELLILYLRRRRSLGLTVREPGETAEFEMSIHTITEYIDAHLSDELKVEDLAKKCNMSYSYFAKCFTELYGQSCKHYISFLRLCKAENMLLFTDYDLSYISQETGFCDCSHLIHAFKEKNKVTPHQFRKNRSGVN
ncbi:MAG: AraC family transcriptional regulator [Lachnospiraceae bacterium]|nr:AraC family transcriptional regulator [Lachnospiraceae bacterium]